MAKPRKRKVGLQKKVSSVFEGVSIPLADDKVQTPPKSTIDESPDAPSKPTSKDSLVSKSSLMNTFFSLLIFLLCKLFGIIYLSLTEIETIACNQNDR